MQLRNKYYPYPVLVEGGEAYLNSSFDTDVTIKTEGYNTILIFKSTLINEELNTLINEGKAEIIYHIECPQTCFRTSLRTKNMEFSYLLKDDDVNGVMQICSFVVAVTEIKGYTNSLFSSDYKGYKFNLDKGCIMAIGSQVNANIVKQRDDLKNTASIFSIIPNKDQMETTVVTDLTRNKIVIMLPEKIYGLYASMQNFMDIQPIMHSMIIVPALMYALDEIKRCKEQLYDYEELRWFRNLRKACDKIGIEISEESLETLDSYKTAQLLLNTPVIKAMEYLGIEGDLYED